MATLKMIDTTKAFTLMAYSRGRITIPEMVELASSQAMPELLNLVEGTKGAEPVRITDAAALVAWLQSTSWAARLEKDLQCISKDGEGHLLLTTWISTSEFEHLVAEAHGAGCGAQLLQALDAWAPLKPDEVLFDGYLKE